MSGVSPALSRVPKRPPLTWSKHLNILGFNCNVFNSAAALIQDGRVVAGAQEERFNRKRHTGDFPENAIRYCLDEAGLSIDDIETVTFHWKPFHHFHRRLAQIAMALPDSVRFADSHGGRWMNMVKAPMTLARLFPSRRLRPPWRFVRVRHHVCHAASAFYASPFEEAATLTVDGSGEMASSTLGVAGPKGIELVKETFFPHSLGYLYVALTHYLGFIPDSDEYKVMALASFGEPTYLERFRKLVALLPEGGYRLDLRYFAYHRGIRDPWISPRFVSEFGPPRKRGEPLTQHHFDLAFALQSTLEATILHMAAHLRARTGMRKLCYAGGTALNSVLNARLLHETGFEDVFIQPAANDAGTAIGGALFAYHSTKGQKRDYVMSHASLGPAFSDEACLRALRDRNLSWREMTEDERPKEVARLLADGNVVGWFEGRMEIGPRALGNRSILADPRRKEMKEILNERVKHREEFRPFAPAVLEEVASEYFDIDRPSPFMLFVHDIKPEKLSSIPAVAHVDGTARIQTVNREDSPAFWRLIEAFGELTGVPVLVNTSFNVMGQPIVCSPEDAIACFLSTEIDALVLNRFLVMRNESAD